MTDNIKREKIPIVTLNPFEKYALVGEVRMHNEYTPATEPVSTTFSAVKVDDVKIELTLVTALVGVPVHELDDITNADASADPFTNPAPLIKML